MRTMLANEAIDGVVIVGYIEKGSTLHGQEMGSTMSLLFKQMELDFGKPVGMGIIGPGATAEQAASRVAYAGAHCLPAAAVASRVWSAVD
jgi:6,7-dimethyl-8-ribityllumazine synthase